MYTTMKKIRLAAFTTAQPLYKMSYTGLYARSTEISIARKWRIKDRRPPPRR